MTCVSLILPLAEFAVPLQRPLTCIESFCGAGGMSLGLRDAGFDVRYAFDVVDQAISTYNRNLGPHGHMLDARTARGQQLLADAGLTEVDLFSGGPPCQGFSKQRRDGQLLADPRNRLVVEYARLVDEMRPKAFLFENVEVVAQSRGRQIVAEFLQRLAGYDVYPFVINSADFGLPQTRKRFLMIGFRKDLAVPPPLLPSPASRMTIRDAIGDLPPPSGNCTIPNHDAGRLTAINEQRISLVPQGGGWRDIPFELRLPCHRAVKTVSGGWPDVFGRLCWDDLAPTITAGFSSFTRGRFAHPEQNRSITPREGARLQGFPDWFVFNGTREGICRQIGNAVPPPVARIAGGIIADCLFRATAFRLAA